MRQFVTYRVSYLLFFFVTLSFLTACGHRAFQKNKAKSGQQNKSQLIKFAGKNGAVKKESENGNYIVTLYSNDPTIPLKKIHTWTVNVKTKNGKIVDDAKVYIFGGMPMHKHDFPTKPIIKQYMGDGNYKVEGIKFSMLGHWQMRFNIKQKNGVRDRVVFDIHINN